MRPTLSTDDLLSGMTPAQREAVLHVEGPLLILAGPGSGKTRVITHRVAYLISQGVRPHQILAITFTNKAAGEMRNRIHNLLGPSGVWISTFHSLGVRLLRMHGERLGLDRNFTIYDQADRVRLVKSALESAGIDNVRFTPETIQSAISKAKNQLLSPEKYAGKGTDFFTTVVAKVYAVYEKKLREANALDFDDLLMWPALALKNDAELRAELDARFRCILIDEYQDTNAAQYEIACQMSRDYPNLCVVGDPDQSIYKWRGANIRNILDFERDFPQARVITLGENFRSTKAILKAADSVIVNNKQRKPKELFTGNPTGEPVHVLLFETGLDEADQVVQRIKKAVEGGEKLAPLTPAPLPRNRGEGSNTASPLGGESCQRRYRDFAIFIRMNALSRNLESAFIRHRVPFQIVRGLAFFERKENKDVLAYIRLLLNPRDNLSFLRAVNEPARGIGKVSLEHLQNYAEPRAMNLLAAAAEVEKIPAIKGKAATGLRSFALMLAELRRMVEASPDEVIRQVIERTGYRRMLKSSDDPEDQERLANIEELITAAHQFHAEDNSRTLTDFLENITLASDVDGWDDAQDCVSVMTLHAAKGLEFPVVYMLANEQGILPHERSLGSNDELEEERRLAFVGMTRAKEELNLCYSRLREFRGQVLYAVPSMFLEELPREEITEEDLSSSGTGRLSAMNIWRAGRPLDSFDAGFPLPPSRPQPRDHFSPAAVAEFDKGTKHFSPGMLVEHEVYGQGKITDVSGQGVLRKLKIRFSTGERTFIAEKAKLKIVK